MLQNQGFFRVQTACPRCGGDGRVVTDRCGECSGEGTILESGTHAELLANTDGPYAKLVHKQIAKESNEINADAPAAEENGDDGDGVDADRVKKGKGKGKRDGRHGR